MSAKPNGLLTWHINEIANALKIGESDVREYFTDGRRVSFLLERRLAYEVVKGKLAPSEGAGYDLLDSQGRKWEVRSVTKGGIYFCPSYMVGSGRSFNEPGFLAKLKEIEGYIILPKTTVECWWHGGKLGTGTKISRTIALKLLESC